MRSLRAILSMGAIFGFALGSATAATYYFDQVTEGKWSTEANWTPNGRPGWDDTAIIPSGRTCSVEDSHQYIKIVEVYGMLEIHAPYHLDLGSGTGPTESILDGEIHFLDANTNDSVIPWITIKGAADEVGVTIKSSDEEDGLITASAADGCQPGALRTC